MIEFKRHRDTTNPVYIIGFLSQWKMYLDELPKGADEAKQWVGRRMDPTVFEKVSNFESISRPTYTNSLFIACLTLDVRRADWAAL